MSDDGESARVRDVTPASTAAELLQIDVGQLSFALTTLRTTTRGMHVENCICVLD